MIRRITLNDASDLLGHYAQSHPARQRLQEFADRLSGLYSGDKLLAVWTDWKESMHPDMLSFTAAFAQDVTDFSDIGEQVIREVTHNAAECRGLIFNDTLPASDFGNWLTGQEFRLVRMAGVTHVDLEKLPHLDLPLADGAVVASGREVMQDAELSEQFLELTWQQYADTQRDVPVKRYSEDEWTSVVLDALLTKAPLVLLEHGRMTAYCMLRRGRDGALTLGWKWAKDPAAMRQLLPRIVHFARESGATQLFGVFASNIATDQLVWELLPFAPAPANRVLVRMHAALEQDETLR